MATSAVDSFVTELRTQLANRAGLSGVTVSSFPLGVDDVPIGAIQFTEIDTSQDYLSMSPTRLEVIVLSGTCLVTAVGRSEAVYATLRQNAENLISEIEGELTDDGTVNGTVLEAQFLGYRLTPTIVRERDPGYVAEWQIEARAVL